MELVISSLTTVSGENVVNISSYKYVVTAGGGGGGWADRRIISVTPTTAATQTRHMQRLRCNLRLAGCQCNVTKIIRYKCEKVLLSLFRFPSTR